MTAITLEYRGRLMTIRELAELAGVRWITFYHRVSVSKLSVEEAVNMSFGEKRKPDTRASRKHLFRGEMRTAKEIAEILGRNVVWVRKNIANLERNIEPVRYTYNGITDTHAGWSRRTGIGRTTLTMRLRAGWPIERVLTEPVEGTRR